MGQVRIGGGEEVDGDKGVEVVDTVPKIGKEYSSNTTCRAIKRRLFAGFKHL